MTNHPKITKTLFKLLIISICLCISIFVVVSCLNRNKKNNVNKDNTSNESTNNNGKEQNIKNVKLTKIAFEKGNNVYLYDETSKQIKSLGDITKSKDLLQLSPDKTKIVFRYFNEGEPIYPPHVIIYDIKAEKLTDIVISNKNVQQIVELKWIDNEDILVTGHINPSVSGYSVYNIKSKAELVSCVGTMRDVNLGKKNILYSNTPHIFPQPRANLYINGKQIFEINNDKEQILDGVISNDGKVIAFRSSVTGEKSLNGKSSAYINIGQISSNGNAINDLKRIVISGDIAGKLKFDDENNLSVIEDKFIYKLNDGKLIKVENAFPKQKELTAVQLKEFRQTLAKQFPKEIISDQTVLEEIDIYNMVAF
ncbi:hypothetical protein KPL47_11545 [Clostridium estertheticum]|uniref:hypothetical protein n=1 Tax=Clostridium estertheticum TaxID=238834 RepID=UPI001C0D5498|nr:hypothetical protein [Clostridium estertheticum]MBU3177000.1 hypothetical protein [Clostridium estertheticum]